MLHKSRNISITSSTQSLPQENSKDHQSTPIRSSISTPTYIFFSAVAFFFTKRKGKRKDHDAFPQPHLLPSTDPHDHRCPRSSQRPLFCWRQARCMHRNSAMLERKRHQFRRLLPPRPRGHQMLYQTLLWCGGALRLDIYV